MTNPIIEYYPNGNKFYEQYVVNGKLHRNPLEGPAHIFYHSNGNKNIEKYVVNGKLHRDPLEGPARILYHENGQIYFEEYCLNGKLHRDPLEGPAYICYIDDEQFFYYVNDKRHNPYGPAVMYSTYGHSWYFNDKHYTIEVNQYLKENNLDCKTMSHTDFDIMWTCIL